MQLPGRLRSTTLGDLLGAIHRAAVTGTLELAEDRGRTHVIHVTRGLVAGVELDGASPSLADILRSERTVDDALLRRSLLRAMASRRLHGEMLVNEFRVSPWVVGKALRRQVLERLATLERLADARVSFRVAVRPPRGIFRETPLEPREFLHGRRRARERASTPPAFRGDPSPWLVLGLRPGVDALTIKRAFRQLARAVHPDMHPQATADELRALQARFVAISDAYRVLTTSASARS